MKRYTVKQYTKEEWDAKFEAEYESDAISTEEDVINIVWSDKAVCMDIMATGKRIVPILRKVEESMTEAGLAGDTGTYAGWFGIWADSLRDPFDRKYFIWKYDGQQDMEQGHWSYSWEIEQIDDDRWYIFLNLALPEKEEKPQEEEKESTLPEYTGKKMGTQYSASESLIVYGAGQSVSIDRTARGAEWCREKGMQPTYTVKADSGEEYTVWTGDILTAIGSTISAACAIPA